MENFLFKLCVVTLLGSIVLACYNKFPEATYFLVFSMWLDTQRKGNE